MIQPVLPLHECVAETLQDVAESIADPATTKAAASPAAVESTTEPLHSATDLAGSGATLTEIFFLCVRF
jgi:hypothetical protein